MVEAHESEFATLAAHFPAHETPRSVITVELTHISDSCGYGVPLMKFEGHRSALPAWARKRGVEGLKVYRQEKNRRSIDGLPGIAE